MTTELQRLFFKGDIQLLGVRKRILVDFSINAIKFHSQLESKFFSYKVEATSIGTITAPEDFILRIEWNSSLIKKLEDHIKSILRGKMNLLGKLKEQLQKVLDLANHLKHKLRDLGNKIARLLCKLPGIRKLCDRIRRDINHVRNQLSPVERKINEVRAALNKLKISNFLKLNWQKFKIHKGSFEIKLSSLMRRKTNSLEPQAIVNVEFETECAEKRNRLLLQGTNIENPFDKPHEEEMVEELIMKY